MNESSATEENSLQARPLLEFSHVDFFHHPEQLVLKNICFQLKKGELLGIIGPNGGGKSTLLKLVVGIFQPKSGTVHRNCRFSYVPQQNTGNKLVPLQVQDLFEFSYRSIHKKFDQNQYQEKCHKILERVGLLEKQMSLTRELSGGEYQRALIGQALMRNPELLILDEPNNGLDSTGQDQLLGLIHDLKTQENVSFLIVDHNLSNIIKHSDHLLCLNKTQHWHNKKELLTKKVLNSIYHCEFEHLMIHDHGKQEDEHHPCKTHNGPITDKED